MTGKAWNRQSDSMQVTVGTSVERDDSTADRDCKQAWDLLTL